MESTPATVTEAITELQQAETEAAIAQAEARTAEAEATAAIVTAQAAATVAVTEAETEARIEQAENTPTGNEVLEKWQGQTEQLSNRLQLLEQAEQSETERWNLLTQETLPKIQATLDAMQILISSLVTSHSTQTTLPAQPEVIPEVTPQEESAAGHPEAAPEPVPAPQSPKPKRRRI